MEPKKWTPFLFLSLFLSLSSPVLVNSFQTLIPLPLPLPIPNPHPLKWTPQLSQTPTFSSQPTLSLQLHHLDSLSSFNTTTPQTLFTLRLRRDNLRFKTLTAIVKSSNFSSSVISGLAQGSGEYFTRLGIGTPPKHSYMVIDTGSDVVWIQCSPCQQCYKQTDPIFNPSKSSSFAGVTCRSSLCRKLDSTMCSKKNQCLYQVSYGDGSFTVGELSTETVTFHKTRINNIALGCGHDNEGLFIGAAGLLGLARGKLSFPSQAGFRFGSKFSYCLVDRSGSSKPSWLMFGDSAVSRTAVFTPLLTNPKLQSFYYIGLTGISVEGVRVAGIKPSLFKIEPTGGGGVIIDSGTSVTRLTRPAYLLFRNAFRVGSSHLKRAPGFSLFDTCFDFSGKKEVTVPTVVLHFTGADVALPASNYLIPVDTSGRFCFAFAGTTNKLSIIGNIQQQGFRVVYDLAGSRIGFSPNGCG